MIDPCTDYEERAAIREHDAPDVHPNRAAAENAARAEMRELANEREAERRRGEQEAMPWD